MTEPTSALFAPLAGRGFIKVDDEEAAPFLQTILTANIDQISAGGCAPGALLTPQGRILHDMIIYHCSAVSDTDSHFIIEADGAGVPTCSRVCADIAYAALSVSGWLRI